MVVAHSKLTEQGQILIPEEVLEKLGVGPGSVLEWEEKDEQIIVRRANLYTSEDIHHALFPTPPEAHTLAEMKEGIQRNMKGRYARR